MPSSHLILCRPLLLLPPIPPSIRVFSNESALRLRWPKYWSFSFSTIPSKEHPGPISFRMDWLDLLAVQGTLKSLLQHHSSKASLFRSSALFTVQLPLSCVRLFATPWIAAHQASLHHQLPEFTQTHIHRVSDAIHQILSSYQLCGFVVENSWQVDLTTIIIISGQIWKLTV